MANRYAVKAGLWSDPTTWDGGTLPTIDDIVRPNNFVVTIDTNVDVAELRDSPLAPATGGGTFKVTSSTVNINTVLTPSATSSPFLLIEGSGAVVVFTGVMNRVAAGGNTINIIGTNQTVVINADVKNGGQQQNAVPLNMSSSGSLTINGDIYGTGTNSNGLSLTGAASLTINGDIFASTYSNANGISVSSSGAVVDIQGAVYAAGQAFGVSSSAAILRVSGPLVNHPGTNRAAMYASNFAFKVGSESSFIVYDDSPYPGGKTLYFSNYNENSPAPENVREGLAYGVEMALTGTLKVPNPAFVSVGVPTDNTVGTATLTASSVWDHEISAGVPAGERLLSTSTVQSTGDQIVAAVTSDG